MRLDGLAALGSYDALFLSPHAHDAPFSCAARFMSERGRGARVLVVTLYGPADGASDVWPALLERWGADVLSLGLPEAARRSPFYATFKAAAFGRDAGDAARAAELARVIDDLARRTGAHQVYVPLGVGGHADHRLAQDAALQVLSSGDGRDVFLYEERPAALLSGAVWLRLGLLGARLPPGAGGLRRTGLVRALLRFQQASYHACSSSVWRERVRCAGALAAQWRTARGWRPQRAFGPRLQPVLHVAPAGASQELREAWAAWNASRAKRAPARARLQRLSGSYSRALGGGEHVERYWLLLPSREGTRLLED